MLNFVPVVLAGDHGASMTTTSPITGIRYLVRASPDGKTYGLRIEDVGDARGQAPDLTFNSEEEAIDYADRFDFNQSVAEANTLPCTLEIRETALAEDVVERYYPDRHNALASARRILEKEYRGYMAPSRATWWTNRAARLLRTYGRVETPDVVLTLVVASASGDSQ